MPREPTVGDDEPSDDARSQGGQYEGAETLGAAKKVNTPRLRRTFREMAESDEDA